MKTSSSRTNLPPDRLVAHIQPRVVDDRHSQQPLPPAVDFSHVDLFSHAPQRRSVQAKLTVGAPNDVYEQEADKVAEQVMGIPDSAAQPAIQRQEGEEEELQAKPIATTITPLVQRSDSDDEELQAKSAIQRQEGEEEKLQAKPICQSLQRLDSDADDDDLQTKLSIQRQEGEEEELQAKPIEASTAAPDRIADRLESSKSGGSPLPADVRTFMEPRFGADFSQVRVHTGSEAVQMNQDLNAQAFAHQQDIYFGAGQAPSKDALTAHELTHVVQQSGGQLQQANIQSKAVPPTQASLHDRLPSAQESEASGRALGQRPQIAERTQPGRIHRCGGGKKDKDKAVKTPEKPPKVEAQKPVPGPLAADELILSSDPQYAKAEFVSWFQGKVKSTVEAWKLAFDPNAIQLKEVLLSGGATSAVVLKWNAAWGTRPVSTDIPFSMEPINARAAMISSHNLPGWSKLTANEQTTLDAMLGGEVNQLSASARTNLRTLFPALAGKTEVEQAQALRGLISDKAALPSAVAEPVTTAQIAYTLTGPTEQKDYEFKGKKADAEIWTIKFQDGVETTIVAPKAPEPGHHNHSVQQAAESASYLPKANRSVITKIMLNVVVNPDDAHWAVEYNTADFHSYMTAGVAGVVTIYPNKVAKALPSDNYMRGTMVHETGHTWSYKTWGTDKTKGKWLEWKQAMTDDQVSVSGYAMNSIAEDVAETIQIYVTTKGSPRFNEYRQIVPKRFAMLDTEYK